MALFNPIFKASGMEIMSIVTVQLRYHITFFVLYKTYYALSLMSEYFWAILSFC